MSRPLRSSIFCTCILVAASLHAQVHEEAPIDLAKGLVWHTTAASPGAALGEAAQTRVAQQSFAASALVEFAGRAGDGIVFGQGDSAQGWSLLVTRDGALRFEGRTPGKADPITVATPAGVIAPGTTHHVAVNVLRDATKPNAGIWVDGVELASGVVAPVDFSAPKPFSAGVAAKHVRLYHRDLTRAEVLALQVEAVTEGRPKPKRYVRGTSGPMCVPQQGETIALIGGTEAVALAEAGELEALMLMAFPETRFHFRSLAWEGDTVFRQDRPLNFGDLSQQLRRVNAGTVLIMFGRQECLDGGRQGLAEFRSAYENLLKSVLVVTPNIILSHLPPYESKPAPFPDISGRNADLVAYNSAIRELALSHNLRLCEFNPQSISGSITFRTQPGEHQWIDFTTDGCNLNPRGTKALSLNLADCLGVAAASRPNGTPASVEPVVQELRIKNRLWHHYWRPTNWAFLHGDRTQQPSSRDFVNPQLRFFPAEQEQYLPLLKEAEEKVYRMVEEMVKKLP